MKKIIKALSKQLFGAKYESIWKSLIMRNGKCCPKCQSKNIIRVPDNSYRHASGNNIYTTTMTLIGKIPVIRYVCCDCGYVENWVENRHELEKIKQTWG